MPAKALNVHKFSLPLDRYWARLEALLVTEQIDVLLRSYPVDDPLQFPLRRQVCFVPDLLHDAYPTYFTPDELVRRKENFSRLISGCGAVGTLSQQLKEMIGLQYRNTFDDIFILPPASQLQATAPPANDDARLLRIKSFVPYFFFPADLRPHRNHALLLDAFSSFRKASPSHETFSLVLSGDPKGWSAVRAEHDTANVAHLGLVPAHDLGALYQNATALVFPSLFENSGMALLEAFGFACPVISSNAASLREIAEDAAILVNASSTERLARAMALVASDEALRQSLIAKGKKRLEHYSWAESQSALCHAFERVHERNLSVQVKERAPLVSIVTPSLNQGRFIRRTIESVLRQTYPNIEYRVVDGGSTDNTLEVLRCYGNRLRWTSEPDRGQANAINKGFANSKGEILSYLNSDDTLNPDAVETVVSLFRKNPHLSMLYGDANYIDVNDQVIRAYGTADYSFDQLMEYCCVCQPAAFWTAQTARQIGPFDEHLHFAMDYDYWLRIGKVGALIVHVPAFLANSRIYPETKTMSSRPKLYKEIFRVCLRHGGYVSERWIKGFLRCELNEQRNWLHRLVTYKLGKHEKLLEYYSLHYGKSRLSAIAALSKILGRELRVTSGDEKTRKKRSKKLSVRPSTPVAGFLPDGYLLSKSSFSSERIRSRQPLRLTGSPVVDTRVEVRSGGELILSKSLEADLEATLEFVPVEDDVTITFDAFRRSKDGQKLAFRLTGTNLFSEQELNQSL